MLRFYKDLINRIRKVAKKLKFFTLNQLREKFIFKKRKLFCYSSDGY